MKKNIATAEITLIRLNENDIIACSDGFLGMGGSTSDVFGDGDEGDAPIRYNYRGAAIDWDDQDW